MNRAPLFPALAATLRNVAFWTSGLWLVTFLDSRQIQGIAFLPFLAFGLAACLFFWLLLGKPRSLPLLVGLAAAYTLAASWLLLWKFSTLEGILLSLGAVCAVGLVVGRSILLLLRPLTAEKNMLGMEVSVFYLLFFLVVQTGNDLSPLYCLPLLVTVFLSLFLVFYQRLVTGVSSTRAHWPALAAIGGLLGLVALAATLFLAFGVDALAKGTLAVGRALRAFMGWLTDLINRVLVWLFSFLPERAYHGVDTDPILMPSADQLPTETLTNPLPGALTLVTLLALVVLAVVLVFRFRKLRLGGTVGGQTSRRVRHKRLSLLGWMKAALALLRTELRLNRYLLTHRNTAQAVYYALDRRLQKTPLAKKKGEAPCAYLRRLAEQTDDRVLADHLETLAQTLGAALYGSEPPPLLSPETAQAIRRGIGTLTKTRTSP